MNYEIYWIAGSPFAWRVLLGLEFKGIEYQSRLLDAGKREHKSDEFLALNPRGKVPVLKHGDTVVYESVAILAYLEARHPEPALFGSTAADTARIWQTIFELENYVRDPIIGVVQPFFRGTALDNIEQITESAASSVAELRTIERTLESDTCLVGNTLTAADLVFYPIIRALRRATQKPEAQSLKLGFGSFEQDFPAIDTWMKRIETMPGYEQTVPPHWRE